MRHRGILAALGGLFGLGACLDAGGDAATGVSPQWFQASAPRSATLDAGNFRVMGPRGYCVDPASVVQDDSASAVLASCVALANSVYAGPSVAPAVIVVSVSDTAPSLASLDEEARQILVQSLAPVGATIVGANTTDGVLSAQVNDPGLPARKGLAANHATALFSQSGRVVSVTAYGIAGNRWSAGQSQKLAAQTVQVLQAANGGAAPVSELSPNG